MTTKGGTHSNIFLCYCCIFNDKEYVGPLHVAPEKGAHRGAVVAASHVCIACDRDRRTSGPLCKRSVDEASSKEIPEDFPSAASSAAPTPAALPLLIPAKPLPSSCKPGASMANKEASGTAVLGSRGPGWGYER